jgi:hypothetical protein
VNQVAGGKELFDIADDYLEFVTKFFEVIKVSAAHIYHSALELCPTSSIIRKLYYHRRTTRMPKVAIGTPDSWDPTIAVSGKDQYDGPCICHHVVDLLPLGRKKLWRSGINLPWN